MERVVLPHRLLRQVTESDPSGSGQRVLKWWTYNNDRFDVAELEGWSQWSGAMLSPAHLSIGFALASAAMSAPPDSLKSITFTASEINETSSPFQIDKGDGRLSTAVFGYGNYVKTVLEPTISTRLRIDVVHELDPLQIPRSRTADRGISQSRVRRFDTFPYLREEEHPDVVFVAGYHHTHANTAVNCLKRGIDVIVEKPVATTREQIAALRQAIAGSEARCFAAYQRRYLPCRQQLEAALGVGIEPVDYFCVVFEEPLPARHWYRWPNSRSRLTSNGCHWIDHFLQLNSYYPLKRQSAYLSSSGAISITLELTNDALFTMSLSERGSPDRGLRDYIEMSSNNATATIVDSSVVTISGRRRKPQVFKFNRLSAHRQMYLDICARLMRDDDQGDSALEILGAADIVVCLEDALLSHPDKPDEDGPLDP
jgi:predicted dehydrogenase